MPSTPAVTHLLGQCVSDEENERQLLKARYLGRDRPVFEPRPSESCFHAWHKYYVFFKFDTFKALYFNIQTVVTFHLRFLELDK